MVYWVVPLLNRRDADQECHTAQRQNILAMNVGCRYQVSKLENQIALSGSSQRIGFVAREKDGTTRVRPLSDTSTGGAFW